MRPGLLFRSLHAFGHALMSLPELEMGSCDSTTL